MAVGNQSDLSGKGAGTAELHNSASSLKSQFCYLSVSVGIVQGWYTSVDVRMNAGACAEHCTFQENKVCMKASSGDCSPSVTAAWLVLDAGSLPWHGSSFHARGVKSSHPFWQAPQVFTSYRFLCSCEYSPLVSLSPKMQV